MRIFFTGGTGLIGRRVILNRLEAGDEVVILSRDGGKASRLFAADANPRISVVEGDPKSPGDWQQAIDSCDVVVNLVGAGVADRRWTAEYKRTLRESRIDATRHVVDAIEAASNRPRLLLSASAVGFYGDEGLREIDESTAPPSRGESFLADLCMDWEDQARRARRFGARVVLCRNGIVLDERGGAFQQMLRPFRFFLGGTIGAGRQFVPWIHWRDLVAIYAQIIRDNEIDGPVNVVSPRAAPNREVMKAIGKALRRPCWMRVPKFALRIALGEVAENLFFSQRVIPGKLIESGYHFIYDRIDDAVEALVEAMRSKDGRAVGFLADDMRRLTRPDESARDESNHPFGRSLSPGNGFYTPAVLNLRDRPRRARPAAPVRLIAIDVDGTLLRNDGRIAQGVIDACRAATRAGCVIVPATARPPRSIQPILDTLNLASPTIAYNGAVIWNPLDRAAQYHEALEPSLVREIIDQARGILSDVVISVEILDRWFTDRVDPTLETETSRVFEPDYVGSFESFLTQPVTKLMLLAHPGALQPVMELVRERYWSQRKVAVFITDPHVIQIAHPMVDKGIALQRIARKVGAARDEVMAIGDGPNDAGMVEWAGFGVAVENACDLVKSLADVIVPSNNDLGVARAIQRYVLSGGRTDRRIA